MSESLFFVFFQITVFLAPFAPELALDVYDLKQKVDILLDPRKTGRTFTNIPQAVLVSVKILW